MLTIRAMSDGKGYSARHLEHSDYYAEGERVVGRWFGRGAGLLGLSGEVKQEEFEALREGCHPSTAAFLRQRQSADRLASDGTIQSRARSLYDFTISAPKSVSIMAIIGGDARLIEAHEKAVAETLQEIEVCTATRVRQFGANEDRITGNLVMAVYNHDTSRELDPQLHTHAVAANLTYDGTECRWKALQASGIYERRAYLTEVYRNSLARELRMLGYEVENRRDSKGRDSGFEIRGISCELIEKHSQRSKQRDDAIGEFIQRNGRQPTDNEIAVLIRETRADKLIEISTEEVRKRQRERLSNEESKALFGLRTEARAQTIQVMSPNSALQYAQEHIFERVSVARDYEILFEALRYRRGHIDHEELKGLLAAAESTGTVLRHGNEVATVATLQREREMIEDINRGIGACDSLGNGKCFIASDRLRPEQRRAIQFVLDCRDRAVNVQGAAGTGKTATLQELRRGLCEAGREVLAVAPTMSAVEELQKVGFPEAITVERLLRDSRSRSALKNIVLIVDEAGMVSSRQMSELIRLVDQNTARVVFCGDTKQIQSVEAGDALRILENESRVKSIALTDVQRQKPKNYRKAIEDLRRNPERGFKKLETIGAVQEIPWLHRAKHIAKAYVDSNRDNRSVLVVCPTHHEIDRVTEAIRAIRKENGELGGSVSVARDISLNWTTAQRTDLRNLRSGQFLGFHRAVRGIAKGETVEVVQVEAHRVVVQNVRGKTRTISSKQAKALDVFERRTIDVAPGDKLLLTANRRDRTFKATNGEIVTVSELDEKGRIHLNDGRIMPATFKQFAHGYAVTAHRSQGKSVDAVIISGDGMQKELFYVAASRGKSEVSVVTSDKERLRESVASSTARLSASELIRKCSAQLQQGIRRGRAMACNLAMLAARQKSDFDRVKQRKVERKNEHSISR
jgi:conjugative relaxase-like TrwC/TraI family protein